MSSVSVSLTVTAKLKKFKKDLKVWRAMKARLKTGSKQSSEVGWFSGNVHIGKNGLTLPTAQIAKWNEEGHLTGGKYGVHFVPPRPFIRSGFMFLLKVDSRFKDLCVDLTRAVAEGKMNWKTAYIKLGVFLVEKMQTAILLDIYPDNRPLTIELKGHAETLIDSQQMISKIQSRVGRKRS